MSSSHVAATVLAEAKVQRYTTFSRDVLAPAALRLQAAHDALAGELKEYEALATRLEELSARTTTEGEGEAGDATSTVLTDLGHGVFATAAIPNPPSLVALDLGLGVYLDLSPVDAWGFAEKRKELLDRRLTGLEERRLDVLDQITTVDLAIQEVRNATMTKRYTMGN